MRGLLLLQSSSSSLSRLLLFVSLLSSSFNLIIRNKLLVVEAFFVRPTKTIRHNKIHNFGPSSSALFVRPLAREGDWLAYLDEENTGLVYYYNEVTNESEWEPPTNTFPTVYLSDEQWEIADQKQKEYDQQQQQQQKGRGGIGGISLASLFQPNNNNNGMLLEDDDDDYDEEILDGYGTSVEDDDDDGEIQLEMSSYVLPDPAKVKWGGEDAVFIQGRTFGLFDGVSGAEKVRSRPLYSVTLAKEIPKRMMMMDNSDNNDVLTVSQMTSFLGDAATMANEMATGASTALVASVSEDNKLSVLNLGDSVCIVIRNQKVVKRTRELLHFFDCPYQLSTESPDRVNQGTKIQNFLLQKGDIVLSGSDGLFDNLTETDVCDIIATSGSNNNNNRNNNKATAYKLAKTVTDRARTVSKDPNAETPYAKAAKRNNREKYSSGLGGKVDDISCVVIMCS